MWRACRGRRRTRRRCSGCGIGRWWRRSIGPARDAAKPCGCGSATCGWRERTIRLTGRQGERRVPIPEGLAETLRRYLRESRPLLAESGGCDALFVSARGTPFSHGALAEMLKRLSDHVGFRITARRLRHACAAHMPEAGAEFSKVQRLLGLGHVRGSDRYTHRATAALARRPRGTRPRRRRLTHFSSSGPVTN